MSPNPDQSGDPDTPLITASLNLPVWAKTLLAAGGAATVISLYLVWFTTARVTVAMDASARDHKETLAAVASLAATVASLTNVVAEGKQLEQFYKARWDALLLVVCNNTATDAQKSTDCITLDIDKIRARIERMGWVDGRKR
jgi:hypothetical protein